MCFGVVYVIRRRSNTRCPLRSIQVSSNSGPVRSSSGSLLGPILFLLYTVDLVQLIQPTPLCRRYSDIWYMASVGGSHSLKKRCLRVWTTSHRGCAAIDSSSTPRRLRCCGVRRAVGNIRSYRKPRASATILSRLPAGYATWASTWISRRPRRFMFPERCPAASAYCVSSGLFGDPSRVQSYSRSSCHWCSRDSTSNCRRI